MTAGGSAAPKYFTKGGISFPFGKRRNGIARVANVVTETTAIIKRDRIMLTGIPIPPFHPFFLYGSCQRPDRP